MTDAIDLAIGISGMAFLGALALEAHGKAGPAPGKGGGLRGELPASYERQWSIGKASALVSALLFLVAIGARCVAGSP